MRTTSPARGAWIHWVALIAMPTWLITVVLLLENVNTRSPETVARKMANTIETLDVRRFDLIYSLGGAMPMRQRRRAVELYGAEVIPQVRALLAERSGAEQTPFELAR